MSHFNLNLIAYLVIFLGLLGLVVLIYRKIPVVTRLSEEEMAILERRRGIIQRIKEVDYKHHWLNFIIGLEKFLRRVKIIFLKMENLLTKWIKGLRYRSQVMTQKSREWIKQKEMKRWRKQKSSAGLKDEVPIRIEENAVGARAEEMAAIIEEEKDDLPLSELRKPLKEEQKWINLIVENPKNITAYKFLGLLYWRQYNYADAKNSLEMAVKLGSKDRKVLEILEEMKQMGVE